LSYPAISNRPLFRRRGKIHVRLGGRGGRSLPVFLSQIRLQHLPSGKPRPKKSVEEPVSAGMRREEVQPTLCQRPTDAAPVLSPWRWLTPHVGVCFGVA